MLRLFQIIFCGGEYHSSLLLYLFFFYLYHFLFSLMKSKQTAVRGPTGGGRSPVTGFYWNPCIWKDLFSKFGWVYDVITWLIYLFKNFNISGTKRNSTKIVNRIFPLIETTCLCFKMAQAGPERWNIRHRTSLRGPRSKTRHKRKRR